MDNTRNVVKEPKCLSRPVFCAQKHKIPAPNASFPEAFYSYSLSSQEEELNKRMKKRIQDIVKRKGYTFKTFSDEPTGTFQYFCNNICVNIQRCSLLIADITPVDNRIASNIIHEIGLAQGFRKNVILVTCIKKFDIIESYISNLKGFELFHFPDDLDKIYDVVGEILANGLPEIHTINDAYEFQHYCLRLDEKPLSRDFYSTLIPSMMRKSMLTLDEVMERKIFPFRTDPIYTARYVNTINARRERFLSILQQAKKRKLKVFFRDMYIKKALREYAEKGTIEGSLTYDNSDEIISRLKGIIHALKTYHPHYEVGLLVDMEAPYKFLIKHDCGVIIDNPIRRASKNALAIFSTIKSFVAENQSLFNRLWELPNTEKDKEKVLGILDDFLKKAQKRKKRVNHFR